MASRVFIRQPQTADCQSLKTLRHTSQKLHEPWITPVLSEADCLAYIHRCQREDFEGLLVCLTTTQQLIGVINLNQIFYGPFQNAYLGYYVDIAFAKRGLMTEGMQLAINYAFFTLKLHRLEAIFSRGIPIQLT